MMPKINGLEVAKKIRIYDKEVILIFLTSKNEEVYRVFQFNTFRFIRKKYFEQEFFEMLQALVKVLHERVNKFIFSTKEGLIKLSVTEILYFELVNRNVEVQTFLNRYRLCITVFKEIADSFTRKGFVNIYRGKIVNVRYIKEIQKNQIKLDNEEVLTVSRYCMPNVKKIFFEEGRMR